MRRFNGSTSRTSHRHREVLPGLIIVFIGTVFGSCSEQPAGNDGGAETDGGPASNDAGAGTDGGLAASDARAATDGGPASNDAGAGTDGATPTALDGGGSIGALDAGGMDAQTIADARAADADGEREAGTSSMNTCIGPAGAALANARLPTGYCAWTWANVTDPRGLLVAPNGDVLVVERQAGRISALFDADGDGVSSARERATLVFRWPFTTGARAAQRPTRPRPGRIGRLASRSEPSAQLFVSSDASNQIIAIGYSALRSESARAGRT
jgi:hypothetical protein